jgi:Mg-chelatase subunit ChlD
MHSFRLFRFAAAAALLCAAIPAAIADDDATAAPPPHPLIAGQTLEFTLTPEARRAAFTFVHDGSRLLALRVTTADAGAEVLLTAHGEAAYGEYTLKGDTTWEFYAKRALSQLCDNLPQFPAQWACTLDLSGEEARTIAIRTEDQGAAPAINRAEPSGTLVVRKVGQTHLKAEPEPGVEIRHPLFSGNEATPDLTPRGDAVFRLPAGYWQLVAAGGDGVNELRSVLIPVSSGGETIVDWPQMRALEGEQLRGLNELRLREATADAGTGRILVAAPMFPSAPKAEAVRVLEGGHPGEVLSVEPIPAKLHVVVLFDSSLSMQKIFSQAQAAALRFVETLPPETTVEFFDFDTKIRELPASDRASLLAAIREIKADGSTKLYDSILRGLAKCAGHRRSAIVVFTDGFDARIEDPGYGSRASEAEVFASVAKADMPLFTIAYGAKPDEQTLQRLAKLSGGAYFRAQAETIADTFDRIRGLVDRDYRITYRRPCKVAPSNTPVITVVLDTSGSMNEAADVQGCDYRMEKAKDLLRGFFSRLPAGAVVEFITFASDVTVAQVPTTDSSRLLRSLAPVYADGYTATLAATRAALSSLKTIPSRSRYLLFITDAALDVDDDDRPAFETALAGFKTAGIRSLWVGMVGEEAKAPFETAAALSGGSFVVSPSTDSLAQALASLEKTLAAPVPESDELALEVLIDKPDDSGEPHLHGGNGLFPLPKPAVLEETGVGCLTVTVSDTPSYALPTASAASGATGEGAASAIAGPASAIELNRIALGVAAKNEAVELVVHEARLYQRLHGMDAPQDQRFLELAVTLKNILPPQKVFIPDQGATHPAAWVGTGKAKGRTVVAVPAYLIPDLRHHLFLRWNDSAELPPSSLSMLDTEPLFRPDDPSVLVPPDRPRAGRLVFLVPDEGMRQASLHLYDTAYRHFDLPLVGPLAPRPAPLATLPTLAEGKLSETFTLRLLGHTDSPAPVRGIEPGPGNLFRTVQLGFDSQVQALLDVNPSERFELVAATDKGPVGVPLTPLTDLLPGGLFRPASLAPGSHNRFQQLFCLPAALATAPTALTVELKGGDVALPLGAPTPAFHLDVQPDPADGIAIAVNAITQSERTETLDQPMLVADITIVDTKDDFATAPGDLFRLVRVAAPGAAFVDPDSPSEAMVPRTYDAGDTSKGLGGFASDELINVQPQHVASSTDRLLFGLGEETAVPDGATRRYALLFNPPTEGQWVLAYQGRELTRFTAPAKALPPADAWLLARRPDYPQFEDNDFENILARHISELGAAGHFRRLDRAIPPTPVADESGRILPVELEPPRLTVAGAAAWAELLADDETALWSTLGELTLQPDDGDPWQSRSAPESVLTQRSGSPGDFAELARQWYAARKIETRPLRAPLTDAGRTSLRRRCPQGELPREAALLRTPQGIWAVPFAKKLDAIATLIDGTRQRETEAMPSTVRVTIGVVCKPVGKNTAQQMRELSNALVGEDVGEESTFYLWNDALPTAALSRDALDVFYYEDHGKLALQLETVDGRRTVRSEIDTREWKPLREFIEIDAGGHRIRRFSRELGNTELGGTYHCVAIATPDLPSSAAATLARVWAERKGVAPPNHRSLVRWLGRSKIAKFIALQSRWEECTAPKLGVALSRADNPRALVFTACEGPDGRLSLSFDLAASDPAVFGAPEAVAAFHVMQGLTDSAFEGAPLGGRSVTDIWSRTGGLLLVAPTSRERFADALSAEKLPESVVRHVREGPEYLLFSTRPVQVRGRPVWGWLEIDPRTYRTRSVLSTGEHGMVEYVVEKYVPDAASYTLGFMVGVDASVWSVCSFTLEGLEYEEVMAQAEKFAQELAKNFNNISENPKVAVGGGVVISRDGVKFNDDGESNFRSFVDGYNAGVAYYFAQAGG